jgi:phosphatidylglycerophosphate synthase
MPVEFACVIQGSFSIVIHMVHIGTVFNKCLHNFIPSMPACMPSFVRSYAAYNGVVSPEKAKEMGGLFERSERILLLAAGLAAGIAFSMEYFVWAIALSVVLSAITVLQRVHYIFQGRAE